MAGFAKSRLVKPLLPRLTESHAACYRGGWLATRNDICLPPGSPVFRFALCLVYCRR